MASPNRTHERSQVEYPGTEQPVEGSEKTWGAVAHASGIITSVLGPLLIRATVGKRSDFVRDQATAASNFQASVLLALLAGFVLFIVLIGVAAVLAVLLVAPLLAVYAAIQAARGIAYRYPLSLRLFG